ncbi:type II secretion system protein F (GspF) [Melghirimyces profundicolus]|uniref:Type II secretion system protein F (GspF) n=1 Tax=Melghirimyces profundicolus TaxID=1242148 RepID=A0A2T6C9P1_9BACL|nr:type II secretion system F family protein [Melghirimyces profundicolus]PTX65022.1 type II secretion system protein F (GspF) [Melghirimyces profundicolus]
MTDGWKKRWSAERLAGFSQYLSHLLEAGLPLMPSIRLLSEQQVIREEEGRRIQTRLDQGHSFSVSLQKEGLPPLFVSLIRAAEEYGDYVFGLQQCETYYREKGRLARELTRALTYPVVVLILVLLAFLFLMITVVPRFAELYETMGLTLPLYTRVFISLHASMRTVSFGVGAVFALGLLFFIIIRRLPAETRERWTSPLYGLPVIRGYFALRFTHYLSIQLGSLLRSGLPLLKAVEVVETLTPWRPLREGIRRLKRGLLRGESLHHALEREGDLFLPSLHRLVALGEESGSLDCSLLGLAKSSEMMIKERLDRLTRGIEPVLIFLIGVVMAATVLALFLPMLQLVKAI